MRKISRRAPRHGEHDMKRNRQSLSAVNMRIGWWISDDGICDERKLLRGSRINARLPAAVHDLGDHPPVS